ncbi:MAG: hypothetical protein ACJ8DC_06800 [Gemmatimonadales bacterium]
MRIRYSVRYEDGLDDPHFALLVTVHLNEPVGNLLASNKAVSPAVSGGYGESHDARLRWSSLQDRMAALQTPHNIIRW